MTESYPVERALAAETRWSGSGGAPRAVRGVLLLVAVMLAVSALMHPAFRHPEGHLAAAAMLPLALSAAVALQGLAIFSVWARAAAWGGLAITGQAVALQLMDAGFMVGYQHYPPPGELRHGTNTAAVLFVLAQCAVVGLAARSRAADWYRHARRLFGPFGLAAAGLVFVLTSAAPSASPSAYAAELVLASVIQLVNLAVVLLAVASLPEDAGTRVRERMARMRGRGVSGARSAVVDPVVVAAALWVLCAGALLAWFVYQNHPHVPDEVVYLYHARYFAEGMLSMPLPVVPTAFELDLMTYEPARWYSPVPPGWPAALSIGVLLGAPWLVNPVLNALNVLLAWVLVRDLYDRRTARISTILLSASPWFIFMGMNFMTHTFTMTCALVAAVCLSRVRRGMSPGWLLPGGAAIGMMALIRPLEGLLMAALLGLWLAGPAPWSARRLLQVALLALATFAVTSITFPYNRHLSGDATTFPLMAYTDAVYGEGTNALGFGANRGLGWPGLDPFPGHGLIDVIVNASLNLHSVNVELLGWSVGSILPLVLLLAMRRLRRADRWMLVVIASVVGVHSLYWFSGGPDFGARYWYLILLPCIVLAARAIDTLGERLAEGGTRARGVADRVLAASLLLAGVALICFVPWRATDKYFHYRNMRPDVRSLAVDHDFARSLVLVRGRRHPDFASAAIYNPLDLRSDAPVYVWDRDPVITRQVLAAYPGRPVWIVDGPTKTGAGFRVVGGPFDAGHITAGLLIGDDADRERGDEPVR